MDVDVPRKAASAAAQETVDEALRAAALRRLSILDSDFEPEFDAIVRVASHLTRCPVSLISLLDSDRLWFKAAHGLDLREIPRAGSFCEHASCSDDSFIVRDALADPRFANNPLVLGWPHIRFYLGKPINFEGQRIGTLCVIDVEPRDPNSDEQRCVADLARVITSMLVSRSLNRQLNERDRLLQQLSKEVPGVIYQFQRNPDGSRLFPYASSAVGRIFECTPEALRLDAKPAFDRIHPDDLSEVERSIDRSADSVDTWRAQFRVNLPLRGMRWLEGHSTPERLENGALVWHGYIWDITERKAIDLALQESEQRAKLAMSAARLGVGDWYADDNCVRFDALTCELYGLPVTAGPIPLESWLAAVAPDDRAPWRQTIREALSQLIARELVFEIRRADGLERVIEFRTHPVRDELTGRARCILISRDITEQHESARLLREKEAAEQADRAKSQFLARVSHELRTPLNAILGFTQLLSQDESIRVHRQWADQLQHIESAGQHLLALINDILDLSRADTGMNRPVMRRVELPVMLERCLAMVEPSARSLHINMLRSGFETGVAVSGDQRRLEQCVVNLLSNAIKYNRTGGTVIVALGVEDGEAVVRIRDTGIGLSTDQVSRLFQPFNRLGAENSTIDGTGLGLSITKALLEQMDGRIEVCSTQGVGSEFVIRLPLAALAEGERVGAADAAGLAGPGRSIAAAQAARTRDVLYVEDNGLNRMLMLAIFAARPRWRLHLAGDPVAATELLERITPDLLMLDLHLPGCSGLELLRNIRAKPALASVPAIAVSADALPEDIEKALAAGFADYWVKPIDTRRALDSLDQLFSDGDARDGPGSRSGAERQQAGARR